MKRPRFKRSQDFHSIARGSCERRNRKYLWSEEHGAEPASSRTLNWQLKFIPRGIGIPDTNVHLPVQVAS